MRTKADISRENLKKAIASRQAKSWKKLFCSGCGKECDVRMASIRKGWKYCSLKCRYSTMVGSKGSNYGGGKWMIGINNINYKHGHGYENTRDWGLVKLWRRLVFERDKYKCQRCGYNKGKIICAHHLIPWSISINRRYDIDNGITLCIICHRWVHSKKNKSGEFINASN